MGLFGFGKKKDEATATAPAGDAAGGDDKGSAGFKPEPAKAKSWFNRAHQVADTNFDYAIDCFVSGLRFDPESMKEHEALYEVGLRRLANGGKPAGMGETMKSGGKTTVEKFAHAEKLWAMDPRNGARVLAVMEKAAQLNEETDLEYMGEVVGWLGGKVMELNTGKNAKKATFVKAMELFESVKAYGQAIEACRRAIQLDTDDGQMISKMKDLSALKTIEDARLAEEGDSRKKGQKDEKGQEERNLIDRTDLDESGHDKVIAIHRKAWEAKPDDQDLLIKLVKALVNKSDDDADEEAIRLLRDAYKKTDQYRFKFDIGDIMMRQFARHYRMLKENLAADPSLQKDIEDLKKRQLEFELVEFEERVAAYPTIMRWRYELGKRMLQAKKYEEAVAHFQDSKGDAKLRVASMEALSMCYLNMEWLEPAVDTLEEAIKAHPLADDEMAKSLKYLQIDALEKYAKKFNSLEHARKAQTVASTLLQLDIRYRDIRDKVNKLRDLVAEMSKKA